MPIKKDPMADIVLPHAFTVEETAKRQAERDAKIAEQGFEYPTVEFGASDLDKKIQERGDRMEEWADPFSAPDPLRAVMDPVQDANPEMALKLMSPMVCSRYGLRGYKPALDDKGDKIKIGEMFVGMIPKQIAENRRAKYASESEEAVQAVQETYDDQVNDLKRQARDLGVRVLDQSEINRESFGHTGAAQRPEGSAGVRITRG